MPSHSGFKWSVPADVESLAWDPHAEHSFVVCSFCLYSLPIILHVVFIRLFAMNGEKNEGLI